jgi:hypothetical protein
MNSNIFKSISVIHVTKIYFYLLKPIKKAAFKRQLVLKVEKLTGFVIFGNTVKLRA